MSGGKGDCKMDGLVYQGTGLNCKVKGPSSEVDKNGKVKLLTGARGGLKSIFFGQKWF